METHDEAYMEPGGFKVIHSYFGYYQGVFNGLLQWSKVNKGYYGQPSMDAPPVRFPLIDDAFAFIDLVDSVSDNVNKYDRELMSVASYAALVDA